MSCTIKHIEDEVHQQFLKTFGLTEWWYEHLFDTGSCFEMTTSYGNFHWAPPCDIPDDPIIVKNKQKT